MADPLFELLTPYLEARDSETASSTSKDASITSSYLSRLTTLPLTSLTSSEAQSLAQTSQSILRSLQSLSKRSHKTIISSADHLTSLQETLPTVGTNTRTLEDGLPKLESSATRFADKYSKATENPVLDQRRKAMLLARNIDRVSDVLDLPTLLSSAISSSGNLAQGTSGATNAASSNYASALDLHAHIKRLHTLYPNLEIISVITEQAEQEMKVMTSNLIASLQTQGIKLAAAMRTIGWLRRVAPELDDAYSKSLNSNFGSTEGVVGAIFLVCRLSNLISMLDALEPLRDLADQESQKRQRNDHADQKTTTDRWSGGQQTERYLKRYIEIFREQSFAIISMYKSIFPSALPGPATSSERPNAIESSTSTKDLPSAINYQLNPIPSALATFPSHLVELLFETLKAYLPNVQDRSSRDSLLTQILYCAGSLGRLGGDFSMMLALLEETREDTTSEAGVSDEEDEWADMMKKHRVQASRLELLASGVGASKATNIPVRDSSSSTPVH